VFFWFLIALFALSLLATFLGPVAAALRWSTLTGSARTTSGLAALACFAVSVATIVYMETTIQHIAAATGQPIRGLIGCPVPNTGGDHDYTPHGKEYERTAFQRPFYVSASVVFVIAIGATLSSARHGAPCHRSGSLLQRALVHCSFSGPAASSRHGIFSFERVADAQLTWHMVPPLVARRFAPRASQAARVAVLISRDGPRGECPSRWADRSECSDQLWSSGRQPYTMPWYAWIYVAYLVAPSAKSLHDGIRDNDPFWPTVADLAS